MNPADPRALLGRFGPTPLGQEWDAAIEVALSTLREAKGHAFHLPTRPATAIRGEIEFMIAATSLRPSTSSLLVLSSPHHRVLLPDVDAGDLLATAELVHADLLDDLVTLKCLSHQEYGVWERGCRPRRITSAGDAAECGLSPTIDLTPYGTDSLSLWWQKWGGELFTFELIRASHPPVAEIRILDRMVGRAEILPYWRRR